MGYDYADGSAKELKTKESDANGVNEEKLPYPRSVFVIIINEFFERYGYFSLRTILTIYLVDQLLYSESAATVIYHTYSLVGAACPIIGSVVADSWLGKFKSICYFSLVYLAGYALLSIAAIVPLNLPVKELTVLALMIIAIGVGISKPSVMPLGADQFVLPQQQEQLKNYFGLFFFLATFGGLFATLVTPVLRRHVGCFGEDTCYPFAFGLSAILTLIAVVILVLSRRFIKVNPPTDSLIVRIFKCTGYAIKKKLKSKGSKHQHWLDYSQEKYGQRLVAELKMVYRVFYMFLPIPIYWALIDQIATAWIFMARKMDGNLGFYTISADQINFVGVIMYMTIIPLIQFAFVPLIERCGVMKTPLQKMIVAGFFVAVSFICAAGISYEVETVKYVLPNAGEAQLRIYNTLPCNVTITSQQIDAVPFLIAQGDYYANTEIKIDGNQSFPFELTSSCANLSGSFSLYEESAIGYYFKGNDAIFFIDAIETEELLKPFVRVLLNPNGYETTDTIAFINNNGKTEIEYDAGNTTQQSLSYGDYTIQIGNSEYTQRFSLGGVYAILATAANLSHYDISVVEVTPPESMHMLWILPPAMVMDIGVVLFHVPGLEFGYSQAPATMKSVIMGGWLLTNAFGNLIVVILQAIGLFEQSYKNFFLYAGILTADVLIYIWMAIRYKYVTPDEVAAVANME